MSYCYNLWIYFEKTVRQHAGKVALRTLDDGNVTYQVLYDRASVIANAIYSRGLQKKQVIAIENNKTIDGYASMLACLKLGIIYTNLDASSPVDRLQKILNICRPSLIVSDGQPTMNLAQAANDLSIPLVTTIELQSCQQRIELSVQTELCAEGVTGETPAYIMFTSGSTGFPKGVTIKHASVINFILWAKECFQIKESDVFTGVNPIYFDNSVFDFYASLFNGASLVPFNQAHLEQPKFIVEKVTEFGCTVWFSVPTMLIYLFSLKLLTVNVMNDVRAFIFGGEGYPKVALKKLYDLYHFKSEFFNVYGPTECTCICSSYKVKKIDFDEMNGLVTLGELAKNFDYVILDNEGKQSFRGELCLLGPQVGLGYYNDLERTKKSFAKNPLNFSYEEIGYFTGDIVELRAGQLHFVGRKDNQIKHMGHRIELEEIEFYIGKLANIIQCVVVQVVLSEESIAKIVACVQASDENVTETSLLGSFGEVLPEYMMPNRVYILKRLPCNPNGKVDRVALKKLAEDFCRE